MHSKRIRAVAVLLTVLMLTAALGVSASLTASSAPDGGGRVPYHFSLDTLHTTGGSGTMICVFRDLELEQGDSIEAEGWLATPEGVSGYEFAWVPAGGGAAEWQAVYQLTIGSRPDLQAAGIDYPSGHSTAGFQFTVKPPENTPEGYYDVYIRALDGMGTPCDMAAMLGLRYGQPDLLSDAGQIISFPRIEREGQASLFGGAEITDQGILLPPDGGVRLGELPLAAFEAVRITYTVPDPAAFSENRGGRTPVLGLKSAGRYSYGQADEPYNTTHSLVMAAVAPEGGEMTVELSCDHRGEVWLTGHLPAEILITSIQFIHAGQRGDRVAAKINLSGSLSGYFGGCNRVNVGAAKDPLLGDVLRLEVTEETNDPYAYFSAGSLLRDHDLAIDAAEYKYMVLLARALPENPHDVMVFYLCAGDITGATEACTHHFQIIKDGQWHYYLLDLSATENWTGLINGMRFDILSRDSAPGHAMEFASMQFFRTKEAAQAAAAQSPADRGAYDSAADPAVIRDVTAEQNSGTGSFTPSPEDTCVVTDPLPEPVTEPSSDPSDPAEPPRSGCRGAVPSGIPALVWAGIGGLAAATTKKPRKFQ